MKNLVYECLKCGAENIYSNGHDGVLCSFCYGQMKIIKDTNKRTITIRKNKADAKESINIYQPIYCKDKETGEINLVTSLHFPLGKESGKDITIRTYDADEWRSIHDIVLLSIERK